MILQIAPQVLWIAPVVDERSYDWALMEPPAQARFLLELEALVEWAEDEVLALLSRTHNPTERPN